jgi:hypothetical protein
MARMACEHPIPNEPVAAVQLATDALDAAVRTLRDERDPAGEQFSAHATALASIFAGAGELARVLADQAERYGDDRLLRTDDDTDPYHRLGEAALALATLRTQLDQTLPLIETYHTAIDSVHIAVDPDTPESRP